MDSERLLQLALLFQEAKLASDLEEMRAIQSEYSWTVKTTLYNALNDFELRLQINNIRSFLDLGLFDGSEQYIWRSRLCYLRSLLFNQEAAEARKTNPVNPS